jgi:hypothetical protein
VADIFGDGIESADDAEERYQQLYEAERRRSGSARQNFNKRRQLLCD